MMRDILLPFPAEEIRDNCFHHPGVCDAVFIEPICPGFVRVESAVRLAEAERVPQVLQRVIDLMHEDLMHEQTE